MKIHRGRLLSGLQDGGAGSPPSRKLGLCLRRIGQRITLADVYLELASDDHARNQGLVGVRHADNPVYAKFCFEHAAQEVGHEKMALHDVMSLGLKNELFDIPPALPETEVLIAYLYWISFTGNPLQRLGYSYWAENAYQFITPLISKLSEILALSPAQLTFFIAHSDIDIEHFNEIKLILRRTCKCQADWEAINTVMETSLRLTGDMLEAVYEQYESWQNGLAPRYDFLHALDKS